ncbi:tRNA (adenosine(37)-N6)-dimethylallyltransferase MiaA [Alteromonas sp. ASW11-36]|uniref:tRNA dimethylallyltransferase n=1 Tax=Alteromonas arenosi TaxID=3055817 RepID=A0ABT7SS92_9ALTE|nr:tRNA (adenosine(37)-N6)-dimethylallyltransferase MiaA [Alteromonas sp. ASW11-36]MDM7859059.1 tRNA (adenosine(37)-N6)-dimethylallyltransferase MiaA [Alteromonas sp. ASW11-36]
MGPTASGKTGLSLDIGQRLNCEIISVDSALIYTNMDIGTAKPTAAEQALVPHHLIDIVDPADSYSVADFCRDTKRLIGEIHQRGKIPLLVGGTMMYYNALVHGISEIPAADPTIRDVLQKEAAESGWASLHAELRQVDPQVAERVHPNDPQRIGRALEVFRSSGKPLSYWQAQKTLGIDAEADIQLWQFAIAPSDRKVLHERIALRYDQMLANGFVEEVMVLRARGDLHLDLPSMRCVGYRQVWQYLDGEFDRQTMREKGVIATRQLAKRQHTWLNNWPKVQWLDTFDEENSTKIVEMVTI